MIYLLGFLVELGGLYFISRVVTQKLFTFFLLLFRHRSIAVSIVTVILFPGTIVHELAHLFTAEILGVRTGKLTLVPESIEEADIKTGSVQIAKTDVFRRYAIGLAPLFVGLTTLVALSYIVFQQFNPSTWLRAGNITILTIVLMYLIFAISNSMFSSPEDLKGFLPFLITIGILVGAAYFAGIRFMLTGQALEVTNTIVFSLVGSIGIVLALNVLLLLLLRLLIDLMGKFFHRRVI
ncbi:hypothetical protein HY409_00150 [Candidatus Gottesmanbacteria bacterium]|nr:hypothetical protein [Candidatus Gottesmanbacteria bacterium]